MVVIEEVVQNAIYAAINLRSTGVQFTKDSEEIIARAKADARACCANREKLARVEVGEFFAKHTSKAGDLKPDTEVVIYSSLDWACRLPQQNATDVKADKRVGKNALPQENKTNEE